MNSHGQIRNFRIIVGPKIGRQSAAIFEEYLKGMCIKYWFSLIRIAGTYFLDFHLHSRLEVGSRLRQIPTDGGWMRQDFFGANLAMLSAHTNSISYNLTKSSPVNSLNETVYTNGRQ